MKELHTIDIHHHVIPESVGAIYKRLGIETLGGVVVPTFDVKRTLSFMDGNGTQKAYVSLADVGPAFAKQKDAVEIAQTANNFYAQLRDNYPERFGAFATLPLPYLEASQSELIRALDELNLDGIMLLSNSNGVYLGDPTLDPIMAELNKRKAVVFVHPAQLHEARDDGPAFRGFLLDFVFDTTRAITNILFNETARKFPDIKFIFAHMGGTAPYLVERLALGFSNNKYASRNMSPERVARLQKVSGTIMKVIPPEWVTEKVTHVRQTLASFYYDTAVSSEAPTFNAVRTLAGVEHIVYGSDFPAAPEAIDYLTSRYLHKNDLSEEELKLIECENALGLFLS
jgi:predicted TIM-barrel fold metal-dependent hydrolase